MSRSEAPRLAAGARSWMLAAGLGLLILAPLATTSSWLTALPRFGFWQAGGHALEYTFLPLSWTLLRLFVLVALLGLVGQGLVGLVPWRKKMLAPLPATLLTALLAYLTATYIAADPNLNDLYYGSPDLVWAPASALETGLFLLLAAGCATLAYCYFGRQWDRWLTATPARRRAIWVAAALQATAGIVAFALPYLLSRSAVAPPNVLLISMDTLRADHLGAYGYNRDTSPSIDRLAQRGVLFEQATSQAPWTLPAHMSLFTGLYPSEHGLTEYSQDQTTWRPLPRGVPLLAERLAREGWLTGAFTGGGFVGPAFGFHRGFDLYRTDSPRLEDFHPAVLRWLSRSTHRPFFLFLHFYNTHRPYAPPEPESRRYVDPGEEAYSAVGFCSEAERTGIPPSPERLAQVVSQYDGEIRFADRLLGEVLDRLRLLELERHTLIVFLSDHGDAFFEHGNCDHLKSLYEPLVHVPLVVAGPGVASGKRIAVPVELRNVGQLILDLVGVEESLGHDRHPMLPLLRRDSWQRTVTPPKATPSKVTVYAEACCKGYELREGRWFMRPFTSAIRAIRDARHKLIVDEHGEPIELYDLEQDPGEQSNLLGQAATERSSAALESLAAELAARQIAIAARRDLVLSLATGKGSPTLDAKTQEQLRALGYVD